VIVDHGTQPIGNFEIKRLLDDPHEALSMTSPSGAYRNNS
jgi:hypothetical protein